MSASREQIKDYSKPRSEEEIDSRFGYHRATDETIPMHQSVREAYIDLANEMNRLLPESREKSLMLTALQESAMWANASIACNLAPVTLGE